mmetsp:Transcript_116181/g.339812  ORF Transcript_116181/g.339812 Transcript_116181/m.339812 type:complete len:290 (+) Transcript_116181:2482-3351(+)
MMESRCSLHVRLCSSSSSRKRAMSLTRRCSNAPRWLPTACSCCVRTSRSAARLSFTHASWVSRASRSSSRCVWSCAELLPCVSVMCLPCSCKRWANSSFKEARRSWSSLRNKRSAPRNSSVPFPAYSRTESLKDRSMLSKRFFSDMWETSRDSTSSATLEWITSTSFSYLEITFPCKLSSCWKRSWTMAWYSFRSFTMALCSICSLSCACRISRTIVSSSPMRRVSRSRACELPAPSMLTALSEDFASSMCSTRSFNSQYKSRSEPWNSHNRPFKLSCSLALKASRSRE